MKKAILLSFAFCAMTFIMAQKSHNLGMYKAEKRAIDMGKNVIQETPSFVAPVKPGTIVDVINKISFSSSLNVNGIFVYSERFLSNQDNAHMFTYGNRAGGPFGNTGNDLKYSFTLNDGVTWDSAVVPALSGHNFRYPSMITYNPGTTTDPHDMYGVFSGPITDGTNWIEQYFGSIKLDGTNKDVTYRANDANIYLNHLHIGLYCSPDGHATVASDKITGTSAAYVQEGWNILNGAFNTATNKFDWQPYIALKPLVKEDGRMDASVAVWSPDGETGYLLCTAIDSNLSYNPYGVEWPIVYKSTDHGANWVKEPPFDFSTIQIFFDSLYSTAADPNVVIPRWHNKWADDVNEQYNGVTVDINGHLHIFGLVSSTISIDPDSLNYFYTLEPQQIFDVYMTNDGWDAKWIDTLQSNNVPDTGPYAMAWDHQLQMTRTPDGSKVFCVWTDTDPIFDPTNLSPDIKVREYNVVTDVVSDVINLTQPTTYWGTNYWMRVSNEAFVNIDNSITLPVTTSIPGAIGDDPLTHQYVSGIDIGVGIKESGSLANNSAVSSNYPNPFTGTTEIKVNLAKASNVTIAVSSILGTQVSSVNYGVLNKGTHRLTINGENLTTGVYFYTVTFNGESYTHKMIVK
jgi:hypothetical protein